MLPTPNIYVIGSQCTGKTTLVNGLAEYFDKYSLSERPARAPGVIQEVARDVLQDESRTSYMNWNVTRDAFRVYKPMQVEALQIWILAQQYRTEEAMLADAADGSSNGNWFISDRSAVDPVVYMRLYGEKGMEKTLLMRDEWKIPRQRMAESLVIVCEAADPSWLVDDGVRLMPLDQEEWDKTQAEFYQVLKESGLRYHVMPKEFKTTEERVAYAAQLWELKRRLLAKSRDGAKDAKMSGSSLSSEGARNVSVLL
ncbi:AAA domain-containing protein [Nemania sp. FL0916]|nr:AAA domain-containing protein [Nemania sp. FL0916]